MLTLADTDFGSLTLSLVVLLGFGVFIGVFWGRDLQKRRYEKERAAARPLPPAPVSSEKDRAMYEQHRVLNDLAMQKMQAEIALLQRQIKAGEDDDRLAAAREFHELNVEKVKLEIDSLRLHIAEQRKRIDDWGLGH